MDKIEPMSYEEAVKMTTLASKILTVIEVETDYTYQDVMRALDSIKKNYGSSNFMVDSPKSAPFLLLPKCPQMPLRNP